MRQCGDCTMCCSGILNLNRTGIPDMDYDKTCIYSSGIGCLIYEERPKVCRGYSCSWLKGNVPEQFRPDKVHALVNATPNKITIRCSKNRIRKDFIEAMKKIAKEREQKLEIVFHDLDDRRKTRGKTIYEPEKRDSGHTS